MSVNVGLLFHPFYDAPLLNWTPGVINPHVSVSCWDHSALDRTLLLSLIAAACAAHNKPSAAGLNSRSNLSAHANPSAMWILMFHFTTCSSCQSPASVWPSMTSVFREAFLFHFFKFEDKPVTAIVCICTIHIKSTFLQYVTYYVQITCLWIDFWICSLPFSNGDFNHLRDIFQLTFPQEYLIFFHMMLEHIQTLLTVKKKQAY